MQSQEKCSCPSLSPTEPSLPCRLSSFKFSIISRLSWFVITSSWGLNLPKERAELAEHIFVECLSTCAGVEVKEKQEDEEEKREGDDDECGQ